jgi:uncharacterized DUF497 family protein
MSFFCILWDSEDDPEGNVAHIAEHGLSVEDVEAVLAEPDSEGTSRSSGAPVVWGYTPDEKYTIVVYQQIDEDTIRVTTAYEVPEP